MPLDEGGLEELMARLEPRLRQALVAAYGAGRGVAAVVEALSAAQGSDGLLALYRSGQKRSRAWRGPVEFDAEACSETLVRSVANLTWRHRMAVLLLHGFGWPTEDVAQLTGSSTRATAAQLRIGLSRLTTVLGEPPDPAALREMLETSAPAVSVTEVLSWRNTRARPLDEPLLQRHRVRFAGAGMCAVLLAVAIPLALSHSGSRTRRDSAPVVPASPSCPRSLQPSCSASATTASGLLGVAVPSPGRLPAGWNLLSGRVADLHPQGLSYERVWGPAGVASGDDTVQLTMFTGKGDRSILEITGSPVSVVLSDGAVASGWFAAIGVVMEAPSGVVLSQPALRAETCTVQVGTAPPPAARRGCKVDPSPSTTAVPPPRTATTPAAADQLSGSLTWTSDHVFYFLQEQGLDEAEMVAFADSLH